MHHLEGGRSDAVWSRVSQPVKEPPNPIFFCTVIGHKCRRQILDDIARLVIFEVLNIIKPRRNEMEVQAVTSESQPEKEVKSRCCYVRKEIGRFPAPTYLPNANHFDASHDIYATLDSFSPLPFLKQTR